MQHAGGPNSRRWAGCVLRVRCGAASLQGPTTYIGSAIRNFTEGGVELQLQTQDACSCASAVARRLAGQGGYSGMLPCLRSGRHARLLASVSSSTHSRCRVCREVEGPACQRVLPCAAVLQHQRRCATVRSVMTVTAACCQQAGKQAAAATCPAGQDDVVDVANLGRLQTMAE